MHCAPAYMRPSKFGFSAFAVPAVRRSPIATSNTPSGCAGVRKELASIEIEPDAITESGNGEAAVPVVTAITTLPSAQKVPAVGAPTRDHVTGVVEVRRNPYCAVAV